MPEKLLCHRLAEYVVSMRYEAIPPEVVAKAKAVAAHDISISFAGVGTDQVNRSIDLIERREGPSTLVGRNFKAAPIDAAFANTVAMRAIRSEDTILPSFVHPGACIVPTTLALAEQYGSSGAEVLTAQIVGYDVIARIAGSALIWDARYRCQSHVFGAFGVAAAAAKIMRLDVEQTAGALAQACNLGAMVTLGMQDVQYGIVTRNGIFAAQLGKCRAPFAMNALEGEFGFYNVQMQGSIPPSDAEIFDGLGKSFAIMTAILKPHPCTASNLVAIELLRQQLRKHGLKAEDIKSITVTRSPAYQKQPGVHNVGPFEPFQATSSLPFALAVLLVDGEITAAHFDNPNEPRFRDALGKMHIKYRDEFSMLHEIVELETRDGRLIKVEGDKDLLLAPDFSQFLDRYARPVIGEAKSRELRGMLLDIENLPSIAPLTHCLA